MLTDTIMYDCIEYLLRDKTDEESLECLCRLLRTIGKELDAKASEKVNQWISLFFILSFSSRRTRPTLKNTTVNSIKSSENNEHLLEFVL